MPGGHRGGPGHGPGGMGRGPMGPGGAHHGHGHMPPPPHYGGMAPHRRPHRGRGCSGCLMPVLGVIAAIIFVFAMIF